MLFRYIVNKLNLLLSNESSDFYIIKITHNYNNILDHSFNLNLFERTVKDLYENYSDKEEELNRVNHNRKVFSCKDRLSKEFNEFCNLKIKEVFTEYIQSIHFKQELIVLKNKKGYIYYKKFKSLTGNFLKYYNIY